MENPFKFGSLVDAPYFTDRVKELDYIVQFLKSENHLVLMSPRRFGKSSLVKKAVVQTQRPYLWLNMQAVLSKEDFAAKLLKELLNQFKLEKMKHYLRNFRIIPAITLIGYQEVSTLYYLILFIPYQTHFSFPIPTDSSQDYSMPLAWQSKTHGCQPQRPYHGL